MLSWILKELGDTDGVSGRLCNSQTHLVGHGSRKSLSPWRWGLITPQRCLFPILFEMEGKGA